MKNTLFTVMLIVANLSFAQRQFTPTTGSWNYQNLSVETYGQRVITGFSEINPTTGLISPTFKITNLAGTPIAAFHLNFPSDPVYLMDFTINTTNQTIVLTGMTAAVSATTPHKLFVAEVSFAGVLIQCNLEYLSSGLNSMIPHQIIHSPTTNQVVVVGTEVAGLLTATNAFTIPKNGFILGLNANNFNLILFTSSMTTPVSGTNDSDMLENITEVTGTGYFISGSANNAVNEQNLLTMGIDYAGVTTHSTIHDITNFQFAGSSVLYSAGLNRVYLLCNNSIQHTFQITYFDPITGAILSPFFQHVITTLPVGTGADVNGFKLQQTQNLQILVSGYVSTPAGALPTLITPFQMLFNPPINALVAGKLYGSGNNSPLAGYYSEVGNSVYINTPDISAYNQASGKNYIVNQNTVNGGYDLNISSISTISACEKAIKANPGSVPTTIVGSANYLPLPMYPGPYTPSITARSLNQTVLCAASSLIVANPIITLAPNPANESITINSESGIQHIIIYDLKGNSVQNLSIVETMREGLKLDVSQLTKGVYIIVVTDNNGDLIRERFVKE